MSVERLAELKKEQERYQLEVSDAQEGLKDLYNYIPFWFGWQCDFYCSNPVKRRKSI